MGRLLLISCLAIAAAGCGSSDGSTDGSRSALAAPHAFPAEEDVVPSGYREVLCPDLRADGTGLTIRLVTSEATTYVDQGDADCSFGQDDGVRLGIGLDPATSLGAWREQYLDPYDGIGGDEEVGEITFTDDAPGLDGGSAEQLTWWSFNDGAPTRQLMLQSNGVRIRITAEEPTPLPTAVVEVVRRSVAVVDGTHDQCPLWGPADTPTLTFTPPTAAGWVGWATREEDLCRFYVEGALSTLEGGHIDPAPGDPAAFVAQVRDDPEASDVRVERAATTLAGAPADRVTWTVVRTEQTDTYEPAGTWRIEVVHNDRARVRWGGTPEWWSEHRSLVDDLVASVAVAD